MELYLMAVPKWMYQDPQKVMEYKQNGTMMKDSRVRLWAKNLAKIFDRKRRHDYLLRVPEEFRDAVEQLARGKK